MTTTTASDSPQVDIRTRGLTKTKRKRRRDPKNVAIEAIGVAGVAALKERGLAIVEADLVRQLAAAVQ